MANPRIPYLFSDEGPPLMPPPEGAILVHLVVNVKVVCVSVGVRVVVVVVVCVHVRACVRVFVVH